MTKQVTKARILRALERIDQYSKTPQEVKERELLHSVMVLGFKSLASEFSGQPLSRVDIDRVKLEQDYSEIPEKTEKGIDRISDNLDRKMDRRSHRVDQILKIAKCHKISGLVEKQIEVWGQPVKYFDNHASLLFTAEDLQKTKKAMPSIVLQAMNAINKMPLLFDFFLDKSDGWVNCGKDLSNYAQNLCQYCDWVTVSKYAHIYSPSYIEKYGYEPIRYEPQYPDDKIHFELHLCFGKGDSTETPELLEDVCICNEEPR